LLRLRHCHLPLLVSTTDVVSRSPACAHNRPQTRLWAFSCALPGRRTTLDVNMHHYRTAPSRRTPPPDVNVLHHRTVPRSRTPSPDVVRSSQLPPQDISHPSQASSPSARPSQLLPAPIPQFLIIGLFALRLTKRLIEGLDNYARRDADIYWLTNFLAPYPPEYALAKISGPRKDDYVATYQDVVSRMKRQLRYPLRFMQMKPDQSMRQRQGDREVMRVMTDRTCYNVRGIYPC
jgi:hypothetical protein